MTRFSFDDHDATQSECAHRLKIIIGFFFTPPLFLATKIAISFVYYSPKTIKYIQKSKIEKTFTGIDQLSERVPFARQKK